MNEIKMDKLKEWNACQDALDWIEENNIQSLKEAWEKCERGDWMLWLYIRVHPKNIRERVLAAGHCANTVRHLMKDDRSIKAVDAAIAFGEGKISKKELRTIYAAADAAYAAADALAKIKIQTELTNICREYLHPIF